MTKHAQATKKAFDLETQYAGEAPAPPDQSIVRIVWDCKGTLASNPRAQELAHSEPAGLPALPQGLSTGATKNKQGPVIARTLITKHPTIATYQ